MCVAEFIPEIKRKFAHELQKLILLDENYQSAVRKMLVTNKDLLVLARRKTYAVDTFNISNLETVLVFCEAAIEEKSAARAKEVVNSKTRVFGISGKA